MEGRLTPTIGLTKIETTDTRRLLPILNTDLDILDAAIGSISGGGMSNPMTAPADLIVGGAGGLPTRLGVGGAGQVLTVVGGVLTWAAPAAGGGATGPAGGDLSGSYPNPQIAAGVITDADVAAANKDGLAGTASLRTLGTGAQQAAAGNDARFTDARAPTAHHLTHEPGGSDPLAVNAAAATGSLRTLGTSATSAAAGNDARFSDSRPPTGAASGHLTGTYPGPSIANGVVTDTHVATANKDGTSGTASMRTLGAGATQAAAGNHAHAGMIVNPMTAVGDVIVGAASGTPARLARGADTQVLTLVSGTPAWQTPASGGMTNPMTAAEDVIKGGASGAPTRVAVGSNGQVLTVTAGAVGWAALPVDPGFANPMTAVGDLIRGGTAGAPTRLAPGTNGHVLTLTAGVPGWAVLPVDPGFANPMTTLGDLIAGGASGAPGRLGIGTTDQVLAVVAGAPAWAAPQATASLLANPSLEIWQRGAGPFTSGQVTADRWETSIGGTSSLSVSRDGANADAGSGYCAACTYTHNVASSFNQKLEHYAQLRGRLVTFTARVRTTVAGACRLAIQDSVTGQTFGAFHTGGGVYQTLSVTATVAAAATSAYVQVVFSASGTFYVDSAVLVVGATAPPFTPLHPADDLGRCLRYYQQWGGQITNEAIAVGHCYDPTKAQVTVPFQAPMGGVPTVTVSAAGDFTVGNAVGTAIALTAVAAAAVTSRQVHLDCTVASGLVAGNATVLRANSTLAARLRAEYNP